RVPCRTCRTEPRVCGSAKHTLGRVPCRTCRTEPRVCGSGKHTLGSVPCGPCPMRRGGRSGSSDAPHVCAGFLALTRQSGKGRNGSKLDATGAEGDRYGGDGDLGSSW